MAFPFSVTYKKRLIAKIGFENLPTCLKYIQTIISEKAANNVSIENSRIGYKGSTSNYRGALFGGPDGGSFTFISDDENSFLVYEIKMNKLFVITSIMAGVFGLLSQLVWVAAGTFLWLCGMNWITIVIRHDSLAWELAAGIDKLNGVVKQDAFKSDEIKHWF